MDAGAGGARGGGAVVAVGQPEEDDAVELVEGALAAVTTAELLASLPVGKI